MYAEPLPGRMVGDGSRPPSERDYSACPARPSQLIPLTMEYRLTELGPVAAPPQAGIASAPSPSIQNVRIDIQRLSLSRSAKGILLNLVRREAIKLIDLDMVFSSVLMNSYGRRKTITTVA